MLCDSNLSYDIDIIFAFYVLEKWRRCRGLAFRYLKYRDNLYCFEHLYIVGIYFSYFWYYIMHKQWEEDSHIGKIVTLSSMVLDCGGGFRSFVASSYPIYSD